MNIRSGYDGNSRLPEVLPDIPVSIQSGGVSIRAKLGLQSTVRGKVKSFWLNQFGNFVNLATYDVCDRRCN